MKWSLHRFIIPIGTPTPTFPLDVIHQFICAHFLICVDNSIQSRPLSVFQRPARSGSKMTAASKTRTRIVKALKRYKLVVVGDGACGKTSLLTVFQTGAFPRDYEPTIFNTSGIYTYRQTTYLISILTRVTFGWESSIQYSRVYYRSPNGISDPIITLHTN